MVKKKMIKRSLEDINCDSLDGYLVGTLKYLRDILKEYHDEGFTNIKLGFDRGDEFYDPRFIVNGEKEETDVEFKRRLTKNKRDKGLKKKNKIIKEKKERQLFIKLKKKYEGK